MQAQGLLQNPFFATTNKDGQYKIENVPPGTYSVAVWHAKGKSQPKPVTVDAKTFRGRVPSVRPSVRPGVLTHCGTGRHLHARLAVMK